MVALRKESVDRNPQTDYKFHRVYVALRKESVDRNAQCAHGHIVHTLVALRKESVDRNLYGEGCNGFLVGSLSARRAWIEILYQLYDTYAKVSLSARRAWIEISSLDDILAGVKSLSARRAWIEIVNTLCRTADALVALRKESVDRNLASEAQRPERKVALRKESVDRNS